MFREMVYSAPFSIIDLCVWIPTKHSDDPVSISTLTLNSVVEVPLSLHRLLGHDLKQVVGMRNDLYTH